MAEELLDKDTEDAVRMSVDEARDLGEKAL